MNKDEIQRLIDRFNAGLETPSDKDEIERLISEGLVDLDDLKEISDVGNRVMTLASPDPSASLDDRFYAMLSDEKARASKGGWSKFFSWPELTPKFALASFMLVAGLAAGYFLRSAPSAPEGDQIALLNNRVSELQEMIMLSLLEKGSATERLKAVNLTQEMDEASKKVTAALIRTLNQDENVNVRLAALEALKPYVTDSSVREALVYSIAQQESPLVQVSLAELMVALQEKSAVKEFEKLVESANTPADVKSKLRQSIKVLI